MADVRPALGVVINDEDWYRSVPYRWKAEVLEGHDYGGRWDMPGKVRALYLARPLESGVVEVYRHLVEPFPAMTPEGVKPRFVARVAVKVEQVLDMSNAESRDQFGLIADDLMSSVGAYGPCQEAALAALEAGYHAVLAPAATGVGQTLAVFVDSLSGSESLVVREPSFWPHLPPDPRQEPRPATHPAVVPLFAEWSASVLAWQDQALCATADPVTFFPEKGGSIVSAKEVCKRCSVRGPCLLYALEHQVRFGVWGGLDEGERAELFR